LDDGRLGLIDFGCCRTLTEEEWQFQTKAEEIFLKGEDQIAMKELVARACFFDHYKEMEPERLDLLMKLSLWQAQPAILAGPFDFGDRQFYQEGINLLTEATRKGYIRNNSLYIWWTRLIFGHRTLLYRLGSRVDYQRIYLQEKTY
jgi:hypothetical protein